MPKTLLSISDLSPELRAQVIEARCEDDYVWWLEEYGIIRIRSQGVRHLKGFIWDFQRSFARMMRDDVRLIVLKARQTGVSTLTMHRAYYKVRFGAPKSQHILVLSKSKEDAAYLLDMVKDINTSAPPEGMPDMRMEVLTDQTFKYVLANGNTIECMAATKAGGRSRAATMIILDEHAFHQYPEENWNSLQPTLEGAGEFYVISTGNGIGNLYHTLWEKAKAGEQAIEGVAASSFTPVFIPWHAPSHRDDAWLEQERADSPLTDEQFTQEYPGSETEAFIKTGHCPFDGDWVLAQLQGSKRQTPILMSEGRGKVWVKPAAGTLYVGGLDVSVGMNRTGTSDRHSLTIIDPHGRHVASYAARKEINEAAFEIYELLKLFNPYLVVERNGPGAGMIAALQGLGHQNWYRFQPTHVYPDAKEVIDPTIGVQMTSASKPRAVLNLISQINSRAVLSPDTDFWQECLTFVQKGPTKWEAQGTYKDDRVISMLWALWGRMYMPRRRFRKARKVVYR